MVPVRVPFDFFCFRFSIFTFCFCAALSFFACASAFSLSACAAAFFCSGVFFFFSMISSYLFSSSSFSTSMFFYVWSLPSCFVKTVFPFFLSCNGYSFQAWWSLKVPMTHLWSLPMWIMSLASASLLYLKYLLLVNIYSICLSYLLEIWRPFVSEVFFLYIVSSVVYPCNISQCFIQSPLLFPSLNVCLPTLMHSVPWPSPSSALKSPPTTSM